MPTRGSIPSKVQISRILSRIQEEIEAVQMNGRLTLLVLHEICKALVLLAERTEHQISTGPEACQVNGPGTPLQLKNFILCQHLQDIHAHMISMVSRLPTVAMDVLSLALGTLYEVAGDSVTSLFQAMLGRLESCNLQIHEHNFASLGIDAAMDNNASPYMEELQKNILHFRTEFLSRLLPSSGATFRGTETICTRLVRSMASRVLIFFIRHASLVRPLSESGKLRMARDMAEIELAVSQNLFPVEQLGAPYRALRAFHPVIFLETSQLGSSPLLQDLPQSVILHHLYSRPRRCTVTSTKEQAYTYSIFTVDGRLTKGGSDMERDKSIFRRLCCKGKGTRRSGVQRCLSYYAENWVIVNRKRIIILTNMEFK